MRVDNGVELMPRPVKSDGYQQSGRLLWAVGLLMLPLLLVAFVSVLLLAGIVSLFRRTLSQSRD